MKALDFEVEISQAADIVRVSMPFKEGGETKRVNLTTDGDGLSTIIKNLGDARAKMKPAHPRQLDPFPLFTDVTRKTVMMAGLAKKQNGEMYIAVLHPGYGWLCFPMTAQKGGKLAENVAQAAFLAMKGEIIGLDGKPLRNGPAGP